MISSRPRAAVVVAVAVALGGALAGCSGGDEPVATSPVIVPRGPGEPAETLAPGDPLPEEAREATAADVAFVAGMIPHHEQALEMAELAAARAQHQHVKGLAARISDVQAAEIDVLEGWLGEHGLGRDGRPADRRGSHDHGAEQEHSGAHRDGMGMAGPEDLERLRTSTGPEFDRLWLDLMIAHHDGAIAMVEQRERDAGADLRVEELAGGVAADQAAEIRRMEAVLAELG